MTGRCENLVKKIEKLLKNGKTQHCADEKDRKVSKKSHNVYETKKYFNKI